MSKSSQSGINLFINLNIVLGGFTALGTSVTIGRKTCNYNGTNSTKNSREMVQI